MMSFDPESLVSGGGIVAAIGAIGSWLTSRNRRAQGIDAVLANALAHEQAEHKATRNELSQSRTNESIAREMAATFGAQAERLDAVEKRLAKAEEENEECRELRDKYPRVESDLAWMRAEFKRRGWTPLNGTPAVESDDRIIRPLMSESVGGYHGRE